MLGVKVYNSGRAIERTVDKAMTSLMLHHKSIPTPDTWICESRHEAQAIISRETSNDSPLVIKPLFGSQGNGVRLIKKNDRLPVPMEAYVDGLYYLQRYIDSGEGTWHDHRVFVIRGKAIGAMVRYGASWVNNVALGGQCEAVPHEGEMTALAEAAANAVDIDYCGVDIIRDRHGKLFVLEVNSIPAWKGLQSVLEVDVAQAWWMIAWRYWRDADGSKISQCLYVRTVGTEAWQRPYFADGHGMVVQDFVKSAEVSAPLISEPGVTVGARIFNAIKATREAVACNTNLGIILLAAPMMEAAYSSQGFCQNSLQTVLSNLTVDDAMKVL